MKSNGTHGDKHMRHFFVRRPHAGLGGGGCVGALFDRYAYRGEGTRASIQRLPLCEGQDESAGIMVDKVVERSKEERLALNIVKCEPTIFSQASSE